MRCLLCYAAAEHLSRHHARERTGHVFMLIMHGLKRNRKKEKEGERGDRAGDVKNRWKKQRKRGLKKKKNG